MSPAPAKQPPEQTTLATGVKPAHRNHDYVGLFGDHIFPTGDIDILERGNNILIIKSYEFARQITPAQRKIYRLLTRFDTPDAPGSVTVVCVWGLGVKAPRTWTVFTHGNEETYEAQPLEAWRSWLQLWWRSSGMYR